MPRYFFDLFDHEDSKDEIGTLLADQRVARIQAVVFLGEYLRDHPELIWDGKEQRVVVRDENRVLMTVMAFAVDCPA